MAETPWERLFRKAQVAYKEWLFRDRVEFQRPVTFATYTENSLPNATLEKVNSLIYVVDGPVGNRFRYTDGTSWITLG